MGGQLIFHMLDPNPSVTYSYPNICFQPTSLEFRISGFASTFQLYMTRIRYKNVRMHFLLKVDEQKGNWDDNTCKLIDKKCHQKTYHSDKEYHMTLNTMFGVVTLDTLPTLCNVCRVHVVFHSFKHPGSPKLECKVEWNS